MALLDIRTLSIVTMLFSLIFCIGFLCFALYNKRFNGLKLFSYANLTLFFGFLFLGFRGLLPDILSIVFANLLIGFAFFLFYYASLVFLKLYTRLLWLHITGLTALLGLFVYFTFYNPNVNIRIIIINSFLFTESLLTIILFIRQSSMGYRVQKFSVAIGFLLYALMSLFRIIWTIEESLIDDFLEAGFVHGLTFLFVQVLIVNTAFSIIWIANSILNHDLETQANLDPLIKILNRRAFLDQLNKEMARSRRERLTFSLIMADIDLFKGINDNYGHLAGDSVLIGFSRIVTDNLRINDIFARYGGEEFLILLPNTEKKSAWETAERIRKIVEQKRHPFNGKDICYTVSFGISSFDIDAQNVETLLENADMALYDAKSKGRNRVEM